MASNNLKMIKTIAKGLGEINEKVVYVGGAVSELYASDIEIADIVRATEDVDVIIKIDSRYSYNQLEEKLRAKGFKNDQSKGAPLCRWIFDGVKLDLMPDDPKILGFSNKWYEPGILNKKKIEIGNGIEIYILPVLYYVATKCEAVQGRGRIDLRMSHDFEDIVFILDNCNEIESEIGDANKDLIDYLHNYFTDLKRDIVFREAIACSLPYGAEDREPEIMEKINLFR